MGKGNDNLPASNWKIFLVLTGEDDEKRPRSKKLLEILKKNNIEENYRVVCTGLSGFDFSVETSEAAKMGAFLMSHGVPRDNIFLEERAVDTLGNMVFSLPIIQNIINNIYKENGENQTINIILITEGFHMERSKQIFLKVFRNLVGNNIYPTFISANTRGISSYYWKRKAKVIVKKIMKEISKKSLKDEHIGKNIKEYFGKGMILPYQYTLNQVLMEAILFDIDHFRLRTCEEFRDYLFSLPVYNQKYKPRHKYLVNFGAYAHIINYFVRKRENNNE